jgi:AraC family transcriptional regulator
MLEQSFYIKGMVCDRCIQSVKEVISQQAIPIKRLQLGELVLLSPTPISPALLEEKLEPLGFHLLQSRKSQLTRFIRELVAEVYSGDFDFTPAFRFSRFASEKLGKTYESISDSFSEQAGESLEKYIIRLRINKAKEMMVYKGLTVSLTAFALGFSSVAHFSRQFKQHTGLTPTQFIEMQPTHQRDLLSN